jgi:hypothetical protein
MAALIKRSLVILVVADAFLVLAFVLTYLKYQSLVPLYVGLLPFALCNYIYAREFVAPSSGIETSSAGRRGGLKRNVLPLLLMPFLFCWKLPALINLGTSLNWHPAVTIALSLLLCIVIISTYGGVKAALKPKGP